MATMNVSLPDEMKEWVEAQVRTGRYANSSDVVRDLIRRRQQEAAEFLDWLDEEIARGLGSGPAEPMGPMSGIVAEARRRSGHGG